MSVVIFVLIVAWLLQAPMLVCLLVVRAWGSAGVAVALMAAELYAMWGLMQG